MKRLAGRVAIITGASSGVGKETAIAFAGEGANLAICARRVEKLEQTAAACKTSGAEVLALPCDVTSYTDLEKLVKATVERFGRIDILVNNAVSATQYVSIMDHTQEMWDSVMKSGLEATWNLMRLCYPQMQKQKYGKIINLGSTAGITGVAMFGAYAAAKEGIRALSRVAAREWGAENITVNVIAPACTSELSDTTMAKFPPEVTAALSAPLGYVGDPAADIAPVMVFLASDESRYITGQTINVDGGLEIHA